MDGFPKRDRARTPIAAALICIMVASPGARAEQKPLWEFGLGPGALALMDYRGANTSHVYPLPVPYFVYHGKYLRADHNGLTGQLFDRQFAELHISLSATPHVRNSAARSGMPNLRPTVEIGPALDLRLWRSGDSRVKLDLLTSARSVITIEAAPRAIGWLLDPHLKLDIDAQAGAAGWKLGLLAGPLFATRRYNRYFYTVARQPTRHPAVPRTRHPAAIPEASSSHRSLNAFPAIG